MYTAEDTNFFRQSNKYIWKTITDYNCVKTQLAELINQEKHK